MYILKYFSVINRLFYHLTWVSELMYDIFQLEGMVDFGFFACQDGNLGGRVVVGGVENRIFQTLECFAGAFVNRFWSK